MKKIVLSLLILFFSFGAGAVEMTPYCLQTLNQFVGEFKDNYLNFKAGKLNREQFDDSRQALLLSIDQAGNDCAEDYPEDAKENVKSHFKDRYNSAISNVK